MRMWCITTVCKRKCAALYVLSGLLLGPEGWKSISVSAADSPWMKKFGALIIIIIIIDALLKCRRGVCRRRGSLDRRSEWRVDSHRDSTRTERAQCWGHVSASPDEFKIKIYWFAAMNIFPSSHKTRGWTWINSTLWTDVDNRWGLVFNHLTFLSELHKILNVKKYMNLFADGWLITSKKKTIDLWIFSFLSCRLYVLFGQNIFGLRNTILFF